MVVEDCICIEGEGFSLFEAGVERLTPEGEKLEIATEAAQGEIVEDGEIAIAGDFDPEETYRLYLTDANGLTYVLEGTVTQSGNTLVFDTSSGLDDHNHPIPAGEMLGKIAAGAFYTPVASPSFPITIHRYLNIHNGLTSPVLATDMDGAVVWRRAYEPFGAELSDPSITLNNASLFLTFLSREYDSDLGLYQLGARWYDPDLGRFISVDPVPGSLNQYAYAGNNPFRKHDRSGLDQGYLLMNLGKPLDCGPHYQNCQFVDTAWTMENVVIPITSSLAIPAYAGGSFLGAMGSQVENAQDAIENRTNCNAACQNGLFLGTSSLFTESLSFFRTYAGLQREFAAAGEVAAAAKTRTSLMEQYGAELRAAEGNKAELEKIARRMYPKKVGKWENHHWWAKYLKGDPNGPTYRLESPYHQVITNLIRKRFPYGKKILEGPDEINLILDELYERYPL